MAQDVQLYTEDFETGGSSFTINSGGPGGNSGDSQWIINNQYSGGGTFPNTTLQSVTAGGTIGFAPQSNYLHIHDVPSGITNNNYDNTTSADRFSVRVRPPSSMPYVGLGWGHQGNSGLRLSFDIGAKLGKATLSYALAGPWASRVSQADIDAELSELREGVGKVRFVPQLTFGLGYSF